MPNDATNEPADSKAAGGKGPIKGDPPEVLDPPSPATRGTSFEVSGTYGADVACTVKLYYDGALKYTGNGNVFGGWFEVPFVGVMTSEVDPVTGGLKKYSITATAGGATSAKVLDLSVIGQIPNGDG
jgi:hypothetical protein